ncbi:hypothetical protein Tco_0697037 [Tanacetum coccineum]
MTTRSAGRSTATPRGERMGRRAGRGSGRTRGQTGDKGSGDVRNVIVNNGRRGFSYKDFLACHLKEYDRKGGAIVCTCYIEKMESVQDMSRCRDDQKVKYIAGSFINFKTLMREEFCPINEMKKLETEFWNHAMVGVGHAAYTDRFHELTRSEGWWQQRSQRQFRRLQKAGTITDEAIRNGSLKKNPDKRGNGGDPSRDRNIKDYNKRTRTENSFATTANSVRREYNSIKRK